MPSDPASLLQATGLRKSFGDSLILDDVSVTANAGDVLALIGPSGAGKSTLLRCLNLLELPDGGQLTVLNQSFDFDGAAVPSDAKLVPLRARVGFIFQSFNLWPHMTVVDNVATAPKAVRKLSAGDAAALAERMLDRVGLKDHMTKYPSALSGGQQQRVAIARALAMEPDLLLFDEPTSALDPELVGEVLAVMGDLAAEGRTMMIVTHELPFARDVADRLVFMDQGRIVEQGPPAKLMEAPETERLGQFLGRQT